MVDDSDQVVGGATRASDAGMLEIFRFFLRHFWLISGISVAFGVLTYAASFLMTPVYRAEIVLVSVEESGGGAISSLLSNLGGLGRLAGLGGSSTSRKDEALAMLQSRTFVSAFIATNEGFAAMYPDLWDTEADKWTVPAGAAPSSQDTYIPSGRQPIADSQFLATLSRNLELLSLVMTRSTVYHGGRSNAENLLLRSCKKSVSSTLLQVSRP